MKWTEAAVVAALRETFLPGDPDSLAAEEWAFLTQVSLRCAKDDGLGGWGKWGMNERTIDVFCVRNWMSGTGFERLAIEVKVTRSDYRSETDVKRAPAWASAHRCCYAAPAGLIDPATLPDGWGLIEVHETVQTTGRGVGNWASRCTWRRTATRHEPTADPDYLVSAGFRRASRAEHRIELAAAGDPAEAARLRDENQRLAGRLETAVRAKKREAERAKAARSELLALEGAQECADCGQPVTFVRDGHRASTWQHVNQADERACRDARQERDRRQKEAAHGAAYAWGFAGAVEPVALRRYMETLDAADDAAPEAAS